MKNLKKTLAVSILAAALGCMAGTAAAADTLVLKAGHDSPDGVPVAKGLAKWSELVEQRTNGAVKIQVYNSGTMGTASDYAVNCQLGTLDIGAVNQSVMTSFIDDIAAVDIPYLVTSYEQADKLFANNGPLTQYYSNEIESAGINLKTMDVWEVGFREFTNSMRPINSVDDIAGIKLRVMDSKVHQGFWRSLGADPVPMSWAEAYTALQQKAIDGVENPISVLEGNTINEVNEHLALTHHNYSAIFIIMSEQTWNKLTPEQQKIVKDSAVEAGKFEREEQRRQSAAGIDSLVKKGMKLTEPDTAAIKAKAQKFIDEQMSNYPEIVKVVNEAK